MYRPTDVKPVTQPVTQPVTTNVHLDDFMVVKPKDIKNWKYGIKSGSQPENF